MSPDTLSFLLVRDTISPSLMSRLHFDGLVEKTQSTKHNRSSPRLAKGSSVGMRVERIAQIAPRF